MDSDVIAQSVTRDDYTDEAGRKGSILNLFVSPQYSNAVLGLPAQPPAFWSHSRDEVLRSTLFADSSWSGAIFTAVSKMASLSWKIKGEGLKARRTRELLVEADGNRGWVAFLSKHLRDYLLTDNGAFVEIVRASSGIGSRIIGLMHLDSIRCTRTGDPDVPVIYRDRKNKYHELKSHQVLTLSDMEDPSEMWFGVGLSAASRAYRAIYRLSALETYAEDKVTGRKPLRIYLVNNVNMEQVQGAVRLAEVDRSSQGYVSYMGAVIIPNIDPTTTPGVAPIDLAGLPENYDPQQERLNCQLSYAKAIGLDPQDVNPQLLASKALGTGAQARVIDDKASGAGIIAWRQQFTHLLNEFVIPEFTSFYFIERDLRDQLQQAQIESQRTATQVQRVQAGILTPEMAKQILIDAEDIPAEFATVDITPVEEVGGDSNPGEPSLASGEAETAPQEAVPPSTVNTQGMPKIQPGSEAGQGTRSTYATPDDYGKKLKPIKTQKERLVLKHPGHPDQKVHGGKRAGFFNQDGKAYLDHVQSRPESEWGGLYQKSFDLIQARNKKRGTYSIMPKTPKEFNLLSNREEKLGEFEFLLGDFKREDIEAVIGRALKEYEQVQEHLDDLGIPRLEQQIQEIS